MPVFYRFKYVRHVARSSIIVIGTHFLMIYCVVITLYGISWIVKWGYLVRTEMHVFIQREKYLAYMYLNMRAQTFLEPWNNPKRRSKVLGR